MDNFNIQIAVQVCDDVENEIKTNDKGGCGLNSISNVC